MEASLGRHVAAPLLLLLLAASCSAAKPPAPPPSIDFIKTSCNATLYPRLCFNTLSTHAGEIKSDPRLLARAALNVTLSAARATHRLMRRVARIHGLTRREAAAVADCVEVVADSVEELRMSVDEMGRVGGGSDFRARMGDIETWVSAAMTDEDTCMDGFAGRGVDGRVKRLVRRRILKITHLTSNGLALVNRYASSKGASP